MSDWATRFVLRFMSDRMGRTIELHEKLASLAFDSLDLVEILMALEDEIGTEGTADTLNSLPMETGR
jgi:acyl carrier protein